jgi:hypothetical protein
MILGPFLGSSPYTAVLSTSGVHSLVATRLTLCCLHDDVRGQYRVLFPSAHEELAMI